MKFKEYDRVYLKKTSLMFGKGKSPATEEITGYIKAVQGENCVFVAWDDFSDEHVLAYNPDDLELAEDISPKRKKELAQEVLEEMCQNTEHEVEPEIPREYSLFSKAVKTVEENPYYIEEMICPATLDIPELPPGNVEHIITPVKPETVDESLLVHVKNPSHYQDWSVLEFIEKYDLNFAAGNVIKYVARYKKKNGKQDLLKARNYLDKLIENYSE